MKHFILFITGFFMLIPANVWSQETLKLSLIQCRDMAIKYSEELKKSKNTLKQAELDRKIATTAMLPSLDGSAMGVYMLPDIDMMGTELQMRGSYMAGITLTQPIYAGGKIISGKKLAKIGQETAKEEVRKTLVQVIADTDNAYWTYVAVLRKVKMLKAYYAQIDTLYQQTDLSVREGMAIENELLRIASKRSEIEYQLQKAKNGAYLCRLSICRLTGTDYNVGIEPTDTNIVVTLSVSIPIFHWGEGAKKVRRAKIDLKNAELDFNKNKRLMDIEAQQAAHNLQDGYRMIITAETALNQATENLRVMKKRYDASMSPLTDLLDAQTLWQQAESNLIEAQTQYKIYETEYLQATGKLSRHWNNGKDRY